MAGPAQEAMRSLGTKGWCLPHWRGEGGGGGGGGKMAADRVADHPGEIRNQGRTDRRP